MHFKDQNWFVHNARNPQANRRKRHTSLCKVINFKLGCFATLAQFVHGSNAAVPSVEITADLWLACCCSSMFSPSQKKSSKFWPWKPYWKGRLSTIEPLVLTSLYQLIFILKISCSFFTNQVTLMRRSTVLSISLQLEYPALALRVQATALKSVLSFIFLTCQGPVP